MSAGFWQASGTKQQDESNFDYFHAYMVEYSSITALTQLKLSYTAGITNTLKFIMGIYYHYLFCRASPLVRDHRLQPS
jgi:hypothetical protein